MPFDGSSISQELRVLGAMLEFFGDEDRWIRGEFRDEEGRACLVGAMRIARHKLGIRQDATRAYLSAAIRLYHRDGRIQHFNDNVCSDIAELRATIRLAYELAAKYVTEDLSHRMKITGFGKQMCPPIEMPEAHSIHHISRIGNC